MTETQALRAMRRTARMERERSERAQALGLAVMVLFMLAAFAVAGTLDYRDRAEGLGASMVPSAEWRGTAW